MESKEIKKPKILMRTMNEVLLNWTNIYPENSNFDSYILQIRDKVLGWKSIRRGFKMQALVENLSPCTCYSLRLKCKDSEWFYFKAATDDEPPKVLHLERAVAYGRSSDITKIISRRPVLLETENRRCKTPLIQVIEDGNVIMATFLINLGADVNMPTMFLDKTPLMVALFFGRLQIANLLLDKGAHILFRDRNGLTALHYAVDSDSQENVNFCVEHGFDLNVQDNKGWTPLLRAVILNCDEDIVITLLKNGADINIKDKHGLSFYDHCEMNESRHLTRHLKKPETEEAADEKQFICEPDISVQE